MNIREYEESMWEAAKNRNAKMFLELIDDSTVMVCGGFRCSGAEYAKVIKEFDVAEYEIENFETIVETEEVCQVYYVISTKVSDERNKDLEGRFHITSTWRQTEGMWKLIFNMDARC